MRKKSHGGLVGGAVQRKIMNFKNNKRLRR